MIHFNEFGRGPAVLLLHGAPSTLASMMPFVDALAPTRRVFVPDLPGYGRTPPHTGTYDISAINREIEDGLRARGVTEVAVLGYSGGSYRAFEMAVAGRFPVTRLVSLAGFAGWDEADRQGMREVVAAARGGFDFHPVWLARMMGPDAPARFPTEAAEVMQWLDCVPQESLLAELLAFADAPDLRPRIGALRIPILARVGTLDPAAPPRMSQDIANANPSTILQIVPGCGHALAYEDREATVRAVTAGLGA